MRMLGMHKLKPMQRLESWTPLQRKHSLNTVAVRHARFETFHLSALLEVL